MVSKAIKQSNADVEDRGLSDPRAMTAERGDLDTGANLRAGSVAELASSSAYRDAMLQPPAMYPTGPYVRDQQQCLFLRDSCQNLEQIFILFQSRKAIFVEADRPQPICNVSSSPDGTATAKYKARMGIPHYRHGKSHRQPVFYINIR